jgi:hypothetical protein
MLQKPNSELSKQIKFFLFTHDIELAKKAEEALIDSIVVDWEIKNKQLRQSSYDMEADICEPEQLAVLAKQINLPVTVRINSFGPHTSSEVSYAINNGASILMLPMAKSVHEVNEFLAMVNGKAQTIVQIETAELIQQIEQLKNLSWDYVYIGLNDLMISCNYSFIWESLCNGTVEMICEKLKGRNYGFGGITVLGGGDPIGIESLIHEYTRLTCSLVFLRRSFKKEILDRNMKTEIAVVRKFIDGSFQRGPQAQEFDRQKLQKILHGLSRKEKNVLAN